MLALFMRGMGVLKPFLPGLGILALELALYTVFQFAGATALFFPPLPLLLEWMLWDPKLLLFRLHDMGLSLCTLAYALYQRDWEGVQQLIIMQALVGAMTWLLKVAVGRQRPNGSSHVSFPSGHTSSAFAGAAFLHHRYGLAFGLPAYIIASTVGCIRVHKRAHYTSDVVAGASVALLFAYQLVTRKSSSIENSSDLFQSHLRLT